MKSVILSRLVILTQSFDFALCSAFGTVDLLDDLLDGWNADVHKEERQKTVEMFQVRVYCSLPGMPGM